MVSVPRLAPIRPTIQREPFDHPEWIFELKYDGFRSLAYVERGHVRLVSRNGNAYRRFDELRAHLADTLRVRDAVIDGEIVCLDQHGRPDFDALFYRRGTPSFVAFDLLLRGQRDLRALPLVKRKALLRPMIPSSSDCVLYADHITERGVDLFRLTCEHDLEGIVAKHTQSPYALIGNRSPWLKIKNPAYTRIAGRRGRFERARLPR